jgi:uncharacterized YccA/Bax inhibitor family protein
LCLLGAFTIGYVQGIQSVTANISTIVNNVAGTLPDLAQKIVAAATSYVQQVVEPTLTLYLAIGVALVIGGLVLVTRGDKKEISNEKSVPSTLPELHEKNETITPSAANS